MFIVRLKVQQTVQIEHSFSAMPGACPSDSSRTTTTAAKAFRRK
jgi:hypothetical protein